MSWAESTVMPECVAPSRLVYRCAGVRHVLWRDTTDPDTFRRLAAHLRWGGPRAGSA